MNTGWDRWSRVYRIFEYALLGGVLERARYGTLSALPTSGTVLLLGDGDGRFLSRALRAAPAVDFVSADRSAGMLARAEHRVEADLRARVAWVRAELPREVERLPAGPFEMIVSQFFIDCFTAAEWAEWWPGVAKRLRPGGRWQVVEFTEPESWRGMRGWLQAGLLSFLYAAFRLTTPMRARRLPPIAEPFRDARWELLEDRLGRGGWCRTRAWRKPCLAAWA